MENSQNPKASWQKILEAGVDNPKAQNDVIFRYLAGMDHRVLQALMEGNIGRKAASDTKFKYVLHWWHTLSGHPCTYINIPCRSEFEDEEYSTQGAGNATQSSPRTGCGPSPSELEQVCDTMWTYLHGKDAAAKEEAQRIDMQYAPVADKDRPKDVATTKFGRRYLVSANAIDKIRVWIDTVRRKVVDPARKSMTAEQFQEPLPWSF